MTEERASSAGLARDVILEIAGKAPVAVVLLAALSALLYIIDKRIDDSIQLRAEFAADILEQLRAIRSIVEKL